MNLSFPSILIFVVVIGSGDKSNKHNTAFTVTDFKFGELKVGDMDSLDITKLSGGKPTQDVDSDGEPVTDSEDEVEQEDTPAIPFPQLRLGNFD